MRFSIWFRLWIRYFYLLLLGRPRPKKRRRKTDRERDGRRKRKGSRYSVNERRSRRIKEGIRRRNANYEAFVRAMSICAAFFAVVVLFPIAVADWTAKSVKKQKSKRRRIGNAGGNKAGSSKDKTQPVSRKNDIKPDKASEKRGRAAEKHAPKNTVKISENKIRAEAVNDRTEKTANAIYDETVTLTSAADTSDEDISGYMPRHKVDSPIAKRMTARGIDGAQTVGEGEYFDIELDGASVLLKHSGGAFAIASDTDSVFLSVSLTLERRIYGVVVSRISADGRTDYEYEAWFDESR